MAANRQHDQDYRLDSPTEKKDFNLPVTERSEEYQSSDVADELEEMSESLPHEGPTE